MCLFHSAWNREIFYFFLVIELVSVIAIDLVLENLYFLDDLTDILNKLEIKILHIKPLKIESKKDYIISPYLLEIDCSYEKLGKFFTELEKNKRLIEIVEFEINNGFERITKLNRTNKLPDQLVTIELATIALNKKKS